MAEHDLRRRQADQLRRRDIILVLLDHHRTAHGAGVLHPEAETDGDDQHAERAHLIEPVAEQRFGDAIDQQCDQDRGEGELDVGDSHDHGVDHATEVAGDQPEGDTECAGEHHAGDADRQRDAQAVQDRGEHVAALLVGAEQEWTLAVGGP